MAKATGEIVKEYPHSKCCEAQLEFREGVIMNDKYFICKRCRERCEVVQRPHE